MTPNCERCGKSAERGDLWWGVGARRTVTWSSIRCRDCALDIEAGHAPMGGVLNSCFLPANIDDALRRAVWSGEHLDRLQRAAGLAPRDPVDKRPAIDLRTQPAAWSVVYPVAAQLLVGRGLTPVAAARLAFELLDAVGEEGGKWADKKEEGGGG